MEKVVEKYGQELVDFVFAAKMCREAIKRLGELSGIEAEMKIISEAWNTVAKGYWEGKGWTDQQYEDCSHDILLMVTMREKRILVPPEH